MARQRIDQNSAEPRSLTELIVGEHLLLLAFIFFVTFGVFLTYYYFGRTLDNPLSRVPENQPIAAAVTSGSGLPQGIVVQRHSNSPGPTIVGIIAGHRNSDSGAVCEDGLQEVTVTQDIANRVIEQLINVGIDAEILDEYDVRLAPTYAGAAVVSIHADSCTGPGSTLSGYKTAASSAPTSPALQDCIERIYGEQTGLTYNVNTITNHMTQYHVFGRLAEAAPAIIVETGFLGGDRDLLTNRADVPAKALADGILCYVQSNP